MPQQPLIARRARPGVLAGIAVGVLVTAVLAAIVWHGTSTSFDTWVFDRGYRWFGGQQSDRRKVWLLFSEPAVSLLVPAAVAGWAAITRRWNVLALAVIGPLIALGVAELILKPLVARLIGPQVLFGSLVGALPGAFPSGHETATVAWLVLVVVLVFRQVRSRRIRLATSAAAVVWALLGALGLTINYFHYATDTLGALACTVAVMLTAALLIDGLVARSTAGAGRAPASVG